MGDTADDVYWSMEKSMMNSDSYVSGEVRFIWAKPNAVLIACQDEEYWIPRSLLSYDCDKEVDNLVRGVDFTISLRAWKADKIGLVY